MAQWIDLFVAFYLLINFLSGLRKGFFSMLINLFSFMLALVLATYTYKYSADLLTANFSLNGSYSNVLGFFMNILILKLLIIFLIHSVFSGFVPKINNAFVNKIAGGLSSLIFAASIVFVVFSMILSFSLPYFMDSVIRSSLTGRIIESDPFSLNGKLKDIFGNILDTTINKLEFLIIDEGEKDKAISLGFKTSEYRFDGKLEKEMLELVNNERRAKDLNDLVLDEKLRDVARNYGAEMLEKGYFSHTSEQGGKPVDRMKAGGVEFNFSGENLAFSKDVLFAHKGLMESPGHRKNILHPFFHRIGIGAVDAGPNGIVFVQNFAD